MPATAASRRDDLDQIGAQRRLAAGQAHTCESRRRWRRGATSSISLAGSNSAAGANVRPRQRHAVDAAEIAMIDQRDPEIVDLSAEAILGHALPQYARSRSSAINVSRRSRYGVCGSDARELGAAFGVGDRFARVHARRRRSTRSPPAPRSCRLRLGSARRQTATKAGLRGSASTIGSDGLPSRRSMPTGLPVRDRIADRRRADRRSSWNAMPIDSPAAAHAPRSACARRPRGARAMRAAGAEQARPSCGG